MRNDGFVDVTYETYDDRICLVQVSYEDMKKTDVKTIKEACEYIINHFKDVPSCKKILKTRWNFFGG